MAKSTLTIAFTQSNKKVSITGTAAVRETVTVTVTGGAALIADGLTLKIQDKSNHGETTPIAVLSTWSTSGLNAVGELNLNTTEAIEVFENVANQGFKAFNILVYTTTGSALMANGVITIMNFPSSVTTDPVTLAQAGTIAALQARIVELEANAAITPLFSDFTGLDFTDLSTNEKRNTAIRALLSKLQGN